MIVHYVLIYCTLNRLTQYKYRVVLIYGRSRGLPVLLDTSVGGGIACAGSAAILRLGLISSSNVTPSNFVIPTIGGSPLFTNSY